MQVGEEFCGSKSEVLQESIKRQSVNYFKNYHRYRFFQYFWIKKEEVVDETVFRQ